MAVQTLVELENLLYDAIVSITGLDPKKVRISYQPDGQPAWRINDNVVGIFLSAVSDPVDKQIEINYEDNGDHTSEESKFYTRVIEAIFVFYGPLGFDLADKTRVDIFSPAIREPLTEELVYPVCGVDPAQRVPSNFNAQWWDRHDLRIRFNVGTLRTSEVPNFDSAVVEIYNGDAGGPAIVLDIPLEE